MTKRQESANGAPDLSMLWDMNGASFELAEKAYRTWLAGAGRIQNETVDFFNDRLEKGLATARELSACKTATEYFEVQAKFTERAMSDWLAQGEKMVELLGELTRESATPLTQGVETPARRTTPRSAH
jgi:hypothetical protein